MATEISIGINTDAAPERQPNGTYRFALNNVNSSETGDRDFLFSEQGNRFCSEIPYEPIGHVYISGNRVVVFSTDNVNSEIGLIKDCEYQTLINEPCLNFSTNNPIDATYRQRRGCDEVIYFTDYRNRPRRLNIANLEQYYDDEEFICDRLNLARSYGVPCIKFTEVVVRDGGGSLELGSYSFAIQFMDADFNATPFIYETNVVNVYRTATTDDWFRIQGGFNLSSHPDVGYSNTSKSIRVKVDGLDPEFAFWRLAVIQATSGTGDVTRVGYTQPISINNNSYTLTNTTKLVEGTLEEVRQIRADIEKAKHIEQLENMLLLANTTSSTDDFCTFQTLANQIHVTPTISQRKAYSSKPEDAKSPFNRASFMADEVYALGIVWVNSETGRETPVFHIPGRIPVTIGAPNDLQILDVVVDVTDPNTQVALGEVKHLGFTLGNYESHVISYIDENGDDVDLVGQVPRWMVFNTGSNIQMGYHQSNNARYPETLDCDGNPYWGDLAGKPIRHHRFPNRKQIPLTQNVNGELVVNYIYPLLTNIPIPDGYDSYYIVVGNTEGNQTISDKGAAFLRFTRDLSPPIFAREDIGGFLSGIQISVLSPHLLHPETHALRVYTPDTMYNESALSGNHLGIEGFRMNTDINVTVSGVPNCASDLRIRSYYFDYNVVQPSISNLTYSDPLYFQKRAQSPVSPPYIPSSRPYFNNSYSNNVNLIRPSSAIQEDANVWDFLSNILSNNDFNYTTGPAGEAGRTLSAFYYVSLKTGIDPYANLDSIVYHRTHNCTRGNNFILEWGDTYIYPFNIEDINLLTCSAPSQSDSSIAFNIFTESRLNGSLNHENSSGSPCDKIINFPFAAFDFDSNGNPQLAFKSFVDSVGPLMSGKLNPDSTTEPNGNEICPQPHAFNPDFSRQSSADIYFPLPNNFNCCEECLEEFPHRYWYSVQSFQEELIDNYNLFLPNNYRDIEGNFGEITNIFTIKERLMIHAPEMLWEQPKNLQQQVTDDFTTFIGTGELFAIPPRRVLDVDQGAGGSQDKWATIKTPVGVLFVDAVDRKVYMLGESLTPISDDGLSNWFFDALKVYYPFPDSRVQIRSTYDPRNRRVIITKIDYEPLFEWIIATEESLSEGQVGDIFYFPDSRRFQLFDEDEQGQGFTVLELSNTEYFRNRSWTISYSFLSNSWVSWHSYLPSYYFYDKDTFYSYNNGFWAHDSKDKFHHFYGQEYPYILDLISMDRPIQPQVWDALIYHSIGRRWAGGGWIDDRYATFDKVLIYNNRQCTGLLDVSVKELGAKSSFLLDAVRNDNREISVTRKERLFLMNFFRDFVVSYNERFLHNLWEDIRDEYYVDLVENANVFDFNKNWQDREPFRGDWIGARFYNYDTNVQLKNKYFIFNKIDSLR